MPRKQSKKPKPLAEGQHMGKTYGFNYIDGCVYLAPILTDKFQELADETEANRILTQAFTDSMRKHALRLARERHTWWKWVQEELEILFSPEMLRRIEYDPSRRCIIFSPKNPEDKKPKEDSE